jgi:hypothetical protein
MVMIGGQSLPSLARRGVPERWPAWFARAKGQGWGSCFVQKSCKSLALELFSSPPTPNLSNLLIEASIYCCPYALNEELKGYPILLSDSRNT